MHLKEAMARNKLKQFAAEHGKKYPRASKVHFDKLIKVAAFLHEMMLVNLFYKLAGSRAAS